MEHIDWIVSFTIFIFVILGVITAIPSFLPDITNQEEINTSKIVYTSFVDQINTNTISVDNNQEIYTYILDSNYGRANSSYVLEDGVVYGSVYKKTNFYKFLADNTSTKTLLFKENFLNVTDQNIFTVDSGELSSYNGQGYVFQESQISSKNNYLNFYAEYVFENSDINIFFNYENENNYSLCGIDNNKFYLYDNNSSGSYLIEEIDVNLDSYFWINFIFKTNYKGEVFCKINDYLLDNNSQSSVASGKIIIKNEDEHYINSFRMYNDNYLNLDNNVIDTYFYDFNITNETISKINVFEDRNSFGEINIDFNKVLKTTSVLNNFPAVIKDSLNNHKLVLFPNIKEFIIVNDTEDINITLDNNLKNNYYNYEIEDDGNLHLWINLTVPAETIKTIYLYKTNGYFPEDDFEKTYDSLTHPDVNVTEISSTKYKIDVDNNSTELLNYEIKISGELINLSSINDSLLITDTNFNLEERIILINKEYNKYLIIYFFDQENKKTTCLVDILENGFSINCPQKTYLKTRITNSIVEYPNIKINNNLEKIITSEKINEYIDQNNSSYYIKIYNEKETVEPVRQNFSGNFTLFERISKYLNEKGEEEVVKVLIKPN